VFALFVAPVQFTYNDVARNDAGEQPLQLIDTLLNSLLSEYRRLEIAIGDSEIDRHWLSSHAEIGRDKQPMFMQFGMN
jgi:hypothetical protein